MATRLSPADRRTQILDVAHTIIERDDITECTIERIGNEAAVTAQLVHKYFGTRTSLLRALLEREEARYHAEVTTRLESARTFEEVVRVFVTANADLLAPGSAIGQLRRVPELSHHRVDRDRASRARAERVLVPALQAEYDADAATTDFVLRLGSAASIEAAGMAPLGSGPDRDAHIERTVRFVLAGIRGLVDEGALRVHNRATHA